MEFGKGPRIVGTDPGRIRIDVDSSRGGFSLQIRKTNPHDYIRNIHVIMPGFERNVAAKPLSSRISRTLAGHGLLPLHGLDAHQRLEIATWDDRPTLEHATFSKHGVALEWMIDLCNRTQIDPWFCMPHLADDEFVRTFRRDGQGAT